MRVRDPSGVKTDRRVGEGVQGGEGVEVDGVEAGIKGMIRGNQ